MRNCPDGKYTPNTKLVPKGCGFDQSLRTTSKVHAKYLRACAYHAQTAVWSKTVGEVKLVKGSRA
jgi:hypothetical protein